MALITKAEMENTLCYFFGDLVGPEFPNRMIVADDTYEAADLGWVVDSIRTDPVLAIERYRSDVFDCDDYALYLKTKVGLYAQGVLLHPLAVGFLFTQRHAFNFSVGDGQALSVIDTQSADRRTEGDRSRFESFLGTSRDNIIQFIYI
jgi:hypothetical protein